MKAKALARFLLLVALLLPTHLSAATALPEEALSLGGLKIGSSRAYVESIYGHPTAWKAACIRISAPTIPT